MCQGADAADLTRQLYMTRHGITHCVHCIKPLLKMQQ